MIGLKKSFASVLATALCITSIPPLALNASADDTVVYTYDGYTIEYNVTNSWGNTDVVSIGITNTGTETIEDWMLYFEPNGDIQYVNNAVQETTDTDISYFKNSGYNANISVGQTVTFSYAVNNSTEIPTDYLLCQTRQERESGYTVELTVNESWGSSFNGTIRINNNSDVPIEMWELTVDTNFTITEITNSWAATVSELEPYSYMLKGTYTLYIAANSYVDLGFTGVKNDTPVISEYNLTEMVVDENAIDSFINDDIMLEDDCIDWNELIDTDADGLPDEYESEYGCNINNSDSDGDGLPDGYEVLKIGSDPAEANSLSETITDGQYDNDSDGLTNYQEYQLGTDPLVADTDYDGLTDGEENNTYHTNPLDEDTDDDEISDGDEVALGLNPLVTDSDSDGILDSEEKFNQNITFDGSDSDNVIEEISVSLNGTGYINSTTNVESVMDTDWMCSNVVGLVGEPYDLSSTSEFDEATVSFIINTATLDNTDLEDLLVLWYDESNQRFVDMEATSDLTNNTLTFTTSHFSKYLIVDSTDWYNAWSENNYPASNISLHSALTIDCSDSMNWNDVPDDDGNCYRKVAASGFINQMDSNDATSMIFFHEDALLVQALTSNKSTLLNSLNSMFSNGYTNYGAALETAYTSLDIANNASSENIIIFVSDGVPTDENGAATDFNVENNTTIQQAIATGTKIYTIGLTEAADETVLTEIADVTGGDYFYAATSDELVEYFLTVNMDEKYDTTTDSDEDGLPDLFETYGMPIANGQVIFTDANDSDADDDGLTDGEEIVMHIVDNEEEVQNAYKYMYDYIPDLFISDNGGIYFEVVTDPTNEDTDGDGITDYDEVITFSTNPNAYDTDEDGIPDGTESQNIDKLNPTIKDTIYSLFPELHNKDNKNNQENNAVYIEVEENSNNITFNIRIIFDEFADYIATDYLNSNVKNEYVNDIIARIGKEFNQISLKDLILDGITYRWIQSSENEEYRTFLGNEYNFYPGLNPNVKFNMIVVSKDGDENYNPLTQHAVTYYTDPSNICVSNAGWEDQVYKINGKEYIVSNPRVVLSRSYVSIDGPYENFITYEGTAAHEFGHILGLPDAYPGGDIDQYCNNGFSCASDNIEDEIYINGTSNLSYPDAGEIMWVNGSAVSNDVEMLLWKYETGMAQHFTPNYDRSISPAIRQDIGYKFTNIYDGLTNQPYSLSQRYNFINNKGYIPVNANIKTYDSGEGYRLQYFSEEISGSMGITIYGLSEDSQEYSGSVSIPDYIDGVSVIKISDGAFMNSSISSITLPNTIVTIGQRAFYECSNLQTIIIPDNVEVIRPYTFFGCMSLNTITTPSTLKYVAIYACKGSRIESFYFPAGIKEIFVNAFNDCNEIRSFTVEDGNESYYSDDGVLFYNRINNTTEEIQVELLRYPKGKINSNYIIPSEVNIIGDSAFINSDNLESISFNANLRLIEGSAFNNCDLLNNIDIPETVDQIYSYAFYSCNSLTNVICRRRSPDGYADNIFWGSDSNLNIFIPIGTLSNYAGWPNGGNVTYQEIGEDD